MKNFFKKGITIWETMIVLAIIGIILAVALPAFSKIKENQVLKNTQVDILTSLEKARAQTLSSLNSSEYGVHFQSDRIIIFKGTVYNPSSPNNETINLVSPATISDVTLGGVSGSSGDIYFYRLSGAPNKTGTNTITLSTPNFSKTITISATGSASAN